MVLHATTMFAFKYLHASSRAVLLRAPSLL